MKKPIHPANRSKKPIEVCVKEVRIKLCEIDDRSLDTINDTWEGYLQEHIKQGHKITSGPEIDCGSWNEQSIKYSYSYINQNYKEEKAAWDDAVKKYFIELAEYNEWVLNKAKSKKIPENIDEKILRAEQRLANLRAAKAGEEIPFPYNYD